MKFNLFLFFLSCLIPEILNSQKIDSLVKVKAGIEKEIKILKDSIVKIDRAIEEIKQVSIFSTGNQFEVRTIFKEGCPIKLIPDNTSRNIRLSKTGDSLILIACFISPQKEIYLKLSDSGFVSSKYVKETDQLAGIYQRAIIESDSIEKKENLALHKDIVPRIEKLTKVFGATNAKRIMNGEIWLGMTANMAVQSWGRPEKVNRTVGSFGAHEQWVYPSNRFLYFENDILKSWQD
jgi:hypothetical protein